MAAQDEVFNTSTITESTGETDHEQLEEIEVIFGNFKYIDSGALRKCRNLQKFTMVNCSLMEISSFEPVSASLVHLCLSNQNISEISGLSSLHELRHLYLQQNNISRIEGLERCRKLKTLWLYDNRLTTVDNLEFCTDLRELWLQNNRIQTLKASSGGISDLVNLQRINLANNRIRDVDEFEHLRKLIVLAQLSFTDEHFGSNPIVHHPEYRSIAITILKQLRQLDGTLVGSDERSTAEDQFFTQSMEFNDQLAELTLAYQQELRSISTRKERGRSNAQMLQQELMEALNDVEACVTAGQAQIEQEKERQLQLREQNSQLLRENVAKLQQDFCAAIKSQYDLEDKALLEEERGYEIMELEAMAEQQLSLTIAALQNAFPNKIAFQQILEHMPDFRFIAESFRRPTNQSVYGTNDQDEREVRILQMYRFFHDDLAAAFEANTRRIEEEQASGTAQGSELYLYMVVNDDKMTSLLQTGLKSTSDEVNHAFNDWVFLFSNPLAALQFYKGTTGKLEPLSDSETDDSFRQTLSEEDSVLVESFNLLLCQVRMQHTIELFHPQNKSSSSLEDLHSVASPRGSILPPPPTAFLQLELGEQQSWSASSSEGHVYMARRAHVHSQILPQFVLLCSKRGEFSSGSHRYVQDQTPSSELLLAQFQQQLRAEVDAYHTRLYHEMDPATVRVRAQLQHESELLRQRLKDNEDRISQEKLEQERILRSLRSGGNEKKERRRK
ncbi:hypothetical protein PPTG_15056 [Phytophthora nicotianae INRA-310]|uniref:Protein phosphatase 1 regulatory subunit 22 n=1 Tax=Phytophthora nicotianae (strain INRA-310) TaxID=761204 RepID=W2PTY1_PHYN3|nr:hypothetical protein PPTG_15056 [Phytophthora nicotianae INRA-310]ETN04382.1 hypothetical protein PPTG_15056 [Phytophthora nicotianae INRA-310]